jgi:hypothetical protein
VPASAICEGKQNSGGIDDAQSVDGGDCIAHEHDGGVRAARAAHDGDERRAEVGRAADLPGRTDQGSGKELTVGGFVSVPPTHRHFAGAGGEETLIQVHGVGPTDITFVNPADDPRKK